MFIESDPDAVILDLDIFMEVSHGTLFVLKLNRDSTNIQRSLKTRILNLRKTIFRQRHTVFSKVCFRKMDCIIFR